MKITAISGGMLETNCYILTDEKSGLSAIIDPGFTSPKLEQLIAQLPAQKVALCLLTHGHFDHIDGVPRIKELTGCTVCISRQDAKFTEEPALNLSGMVPSSGGSFVPDRVLEDGETVELGSLKIKVLSTPGHTIGSCCFVVEDVIFSGDTLMSGSMGRTDFPTGSARDMERSLKLLADLEGDYHVLPGHGPDTTLERERRYNPFLNNEGFFE